MFSANSVTKIFVITRMHSSRMRTGCSLTVYCSVLPGGWGGGGVLLGLGGAWSWGVLLGLGGFSLVRGGSPWSGGVSLVLGGVCLVRGVLLGPRGVVPGPGGVCLVWGGSPETPSVDRITDTCKNITLATTSLRPVKMARTCHLLCKVPGVIGLRYQV